MQTIAGVLTFGERLRQIRERFQVSQKELAGRLGHVDNSTVSQWERRVFPPKSRTLERLADALGVTTADLLDDVQTPYSLPVEGMTPPDRSTPHALPHTTSEARMTDDHRWLLAQVRVMNPAQARAIRAVVQRELGALWQHRREPKTKAEGH